MAGKVQSVAAAMCVEAVHIIVDQEEEGARPASGSEF